MLRTFVWALPHQYHAVAPAGTSVQVDLASGGVWHMVCNGAARWSLHVGPAVAADATALFSDDAGRRWLAGADLPPGGAELRGPSELTAPLLRVRGILA